MFGRVYGRIFLTRDLGLQNGDDTPDTATLSEILETYEQWDIFLDLPYKNKQLFTMFETSDVHPDIISQMKKFTRVIVPFDYLKDILTRHGVHAIALGWYTSELIRYGPKVIPKTIDPLRRIFLYVGTNDVRKNLVKLVRYFNDRPQDLLIVKTNNTNNLNLTNNIKVITGHISLDKLASLYNMCDYVITFTHGEGVGLCLLEANYFNKPIICHTGGVFRDIKKIVSVPWYELPYEEVDIDYSQVPGFLKKVFWGTWWEIKPECIQNAIQF